jgi:dihydropteroate synthase
MTRTFEARGRTISVDGPALMGIVNASPESVSGDGRVAPAEQAARAVEQLDAGALVVDLGGQSANTKTPELAVDEEIGRLVPLIEAIRARDGRLLSVDTYKPAVADACLAAGADIINDVSGLADPALADVVAAWDAGYVLMHTVGAPKTKVLDPALYEDVVEAVLSFFDDALDRLAHAGVSPHQVVLDPGLDFGKTPRQSLDLVARAGEVHDATDRPLLFAVSRKDFIGAISGSPPRDRDAGTLATVAALASSAPHSIFRVHDVAASVQFLSVRAHIEDPDLLPVDADLADRLRREPLRG